MTDTHTLTQNDPTQGGAPRGADRQLQDEIVKAVCDALLPALEPPADALGDPVLEAYYRDGAVARGIDVAVAAAVPTLDATLRRAIAGLAEHLAAAGFLDAGADAGADADADAGRRIELLRAAGDASLTHRNAVRQLKSMAMGTFVNAVDESGTNPVWPAIGYGPLTYRPATPGETPKNLRVETPQPGDEVVLTADVVVVGSGAGGGVIAARAAEAGLSVIVLDAGPHVVDAKRTQHGAEGGPLFLGRGGLFSETGQMGILAGSAVGGGTLINSMVSLRPPQKIRELWASEGLEGLDGPEFDALLDRVWSRLGVNTEASHHNANTRAMITGLAELGYRHERLPRNFVADGVSEFCPFCAEGCTHQQGYRASTVVTYLDDAVASGARIFAGAWVDRVIAADGRASGVVGSIETADGPRPLRVDAPTVVVAAGGIESPALLLRSGIGGPAVGRNLRLHPAWIVTGVYDEAIEAWHGQIQSAVSFDLTEVVDGEGFLVESLSLNIGSWAGLSPLADGRTARDRMRSFDRYATWHGVAHDHGAGRIVLDEEGRAALIWDLDDDIDYRVGVRAHQELARMHRAAGAKEIFTFLWRDLRWRDGEDFEAFLEALAAEPPRDHLAMSAHQMGSCRLGSDPAVSVADGRGQLHDVAGVWIGDASALPTAPGVNPMITVMAVAERTAEALVGTAAPATTAAATAHASAREAD
ncbi:GMC family oxidoreductase [Herbiconiux sp.]|uniref:GMC family oxidoreductase n=1 Tax=Herbiconiux sp. TaxID=1871186 RepID=UPI0025C2DC6F|nr:GMC family oxidoreductase [Herbiconiux sp.]